MPDPIEELRHFTPGVDVDPLPASEVRRRGDRRRRRTNALATVGGVAAVAALVVPLSLAVRGTDRSDPQPVGPSPSTASSTAVPGLAWRQRIPADFDLTALPAGATFSYTPREAAGVDRLQLCGTTAFDTGPGAEVPVVDSAGAVHGEAGTESTSARTLALYPSDQAAATVLGAIEEAVRACPVQRQDPGAPLVHAVVDTALATDDSFVFTQQARMDAQLYADLTVFQVARVGNALYVATSSTSAGGPQVVAAEVRRTAEQSAPVLSDMCTFAAQRC
jgi:hypothetical protein